MDDRPVEHEPLALDRQARAVDPGIVGGDACEVRWLLGLLLDEPLRQWSRAELVSALSLTAVALDDAVADLARCGLAHQSGEYVFASRAAAECDRLLL